MIEITQEDREAAAKAAVLVEMRELILNGRADHHAEPWAKHRLAERDRIVRYLGRNRDDIERCLAAHDIDAGEHVKKGAQDA